MKKRTLHGMSADSLRRSATYASMVVAIILIVTKLFAYLLTDSVALLSTLIDSSVDLLASCVAAYGVAHALKPPDRDHRYGHGKAEPLAALVQAAFITGSAVLLGIEAIDRFYQPREVQEAGVGQAVMVLAIVLTFALVKFQKYVVKRTGSIAVGADSLHYTGDVLINGSVMLTLALPQWTNQSWLDPLFAIGIVGVLMFGAFKIARKALNVLMDQELSENERDLIVATALSHHQVRGVHDIRTRSDSGRIFIELHLEMDGFLTLRVAHTITEEVMALLEQQFPGADILVHQDPAGIEEKRLDHAIETNNSSETV